MQMHFRIVFGEARVEKRYRGIAWRTYFRRINFSRVLMDQKVQNESLDSSNEMRYV